MDDVEAKIPKAIVIWAFLSLGPGRRLLIDAAHILEEFEREILRK